MDEAIPYVTDATFDAEVIRASLPVLACCWSKSISTGTKLNRTDIENQEEISEEYAGRMNVVKLNVDENLQTSAKFGIRVDFYSMLMLFMNGEILWKQSIWPMSKSQVTDLIDIYIKIKNGCANGQQHKELERWLAEQGDSHGESNPIKNQLLLIAETSDTAIASGELSEEQVRILVDAILTPHSSICFKTAELISLLHEKGVDVTPVLRELLKSTEEQVRILVNGGTLPPTLQADSLKLVIRLLHNHGNGVDVTTILRELYNSKKAKFRDLALLCIQREAISLPITDEILIAELTKKGKSVPAMAGMIASCTFRKLWLLPQLELAAEKYPEMEIYFKLLRDGYMLTRNQDGSYRIHYVSIQGVKFWRDISISEYENLNAGINAKGIDVAMRETIKHFNDDQLSNLLTNKLVRPIPIEEHRTVYAI